jgi:hypothetical protein
MRITTVTALSLIAILAPASAAAHAPSVQSAENSSPATAAVIEDPQLSQAIGATIAHPGEVDWWRMDLHAGDPIVVGMTAPDAVGSLPASFVLLGPGLPAPAPTDSQAAELAAQVGAAGAIRFEPASEPVREVHAGLGFIEYGDLRLTAPADGTYWIAVFAQEPGSTGKYVLAPGTREEFGADALRGMAELVLFFNAPWPSASPSPATSPAVSPSSSGSPAG